MTRVLASRRQPLNGRVVAHQMMSLDNRAGGNAGALGFEFILTARVPRGSVDLAAGETQNGEARR